jgi:membrane protein required for colicin V production
MSVAFQFLDVAVVVVVLVSAIYATYRGFVSESLSIFGWIAAAFATLYFGPWASYWLRGMISPAWLGEVVGYVVVFLIVVIPLSFASYRVAQNVKKSQVGTLDGALGAAFGIVRGLAIVGIAYLIFTAFVAPEHQPGWVTKARLMPVIRASAQVVLSLVPDQDIHRHMRQELRQPAVNPQKMEKTAKTTPLPPSGKKHPKKTYGAKDRQALDRLIEATGSDTSGKR